MLTFSEALTAIKKRELLRRTIWPAGQYVTMVKGNNVILYFKSASMAHITPWMTLGQEDVLAIDWEMA